MSTVILFNKPYGVLCQFTAEGDKPTLREFVRKPGFYPAGRLDADSEGLVVLTDDGALQHRITDPRAKFPKTYLVQVEGTPPDAALAQLRAGVPLRDGRTRPAIVRVIAEPDWLWPRTPPIRARRLIPTAWLELTITEGRNRQVRHMTAAVGHPTLRLIRRAIGPWSLEGLAPGTTVSATAPASPAATIRSRPPHRAAGTAGRSTDPQRRPPDIRPAPPRTARPHRTNKRK